MLQGKWALVTGATAGLGLAVAESLAGAGANIVLHDLHEPREVADRLRSRFGVEAISVAADLSQRSSIEAMMGELLGRLEAIDILVNNAVVRHFSPVETFAPEHWEEALAVNLSAPFHLIRLALPAMKKRGWGRIINMASIYSSRAVADRIDYVTTKTAILGMTRAVAIETRDGRVLSGLLAGRDEKEVVLKDAQNKVLRLPVSDVEQLVTQQQSLMPELLLRDMTAQQVADLLEYLGSLK